MKALLRKEFYLFGGKKSLLILALSALPAILLNWSAIPFAYALTVCILPFSASSSCCTLAKRSSGYTLNPRISAASP